MALMDLATIKTRLGITTDADGDEFLTNQLAMLEAKIKRRTGREIEVKSYVDTWLKPTTIMTADWPVVSVTSLVVDDTTLVADTDYRIDNSQGVVQRLSDGKLRGDGDWDGVNTAVFTYSAGASSLNAELAGLYDRVIGKLWADRVAAGGTTVDIYSSRPRRVTMADIGSVEYGTPSGSEAVTAGYDFVAGFPLDCLDAFTDMGVRYLPEFREVSVAS